MAQKQKKKQRPSPIDDPPTASSSEEEEEEEDQLPSTQQHMQEQVSSSEEEEVPSLPPASANPPSSETDTDSEPTPTKGKSKPVDLAQKSKPLPKSGAKRTAQNNTHVADPKRGKKKSSNASSSSVTNNEMEQEDKKKSGLTKMFQRVWSEEDEHAILKGMAEFISMTGQEPYRYAEAFHNFVKKSLHAEASSMQLKEKIRRMKKKFETNSRRGKNGKDPRFSKPLDQIAYELGKKVWGEEAHGLVEKPKPIGKKVANTPKKEDATSKNVSIPETKTHPEELEPEPEPERMELEESGKFDSGDEGLLYREISGFKELDEVEIKRGLTLIGESKKKELEGKWKKLQLAEMELVANRSLLIGEQIKLIFEALQSSAN